MQLVCSKTYCNDESIEENTGPKPTISQSGKQKGKPMIRKLQIKFKEGAGNNKNGYFKIHQKSCLDRDKGNLGQQI